MAGNRSDVLCWIVDFARREIGLEIASERAASVLPALAERLRVRGIARWSDFPRLLGTRAGNDERKRLVCALTTNVTGFFREPHHFRFLEDCVLPGLARRARDGDALRLWSAGCATGPEAYTIAMLLLEALPEAPRLDVGILASDIDSEALRQARTGRFDALQLEPVPAGLRDRHFRPVPRPNHLTTFRATPELRRLISFREANLLDPWRHGPYDVIFCRNVLLHFDRRAGASIWPRFAAACRPDGYLFLGQSDRPPPELARAFRPVAETTHRRRP